jgi:1-phosphatidylinositol-3-phosphate 5-kinase
MSVSVGAANISAVQAQQPQQELTSFGFLNEEGDEQPSIFDLGSILSRVRNAFVPSDYPAEDSAPSTVNHTPASTGASTNTSAAGGPSKQAIVGGITNRKASVDHQRKLSKTYPAASDSKTKATEKSTSHEASASTSQLTSIKDGKAKLPFALSSSRRAPAVISTTAAHAVTRGNRIQSSSISDDRSVAADDREVEDGEDVLTALMRRSGVDHTRASAGRYTSIPGFPLSKDILADDNRSVHSASSRMPRSEVNSTSEAQYVVAHSHVHQRHHSRAGLGTSAEAFRRMRGEGAVLSKAFWMPDENVKECRECQSYFTPFRRKHHCRICGLVYCSRCASNIVSGSRFGLEGSEIRVCNFCLRMLSEYERAGLRSSSSQASLKSSPKRVATTYARKRAESTGIGSKPDKGMISGPLEAQLTHPQAQFAANQLFSYPMNGLTKGLHGMSSRYDLMEGVDEESRPQTPIADMLIRIDDEYLDEPVPFRRKLSEEDGVIRDDDGMDNEDPQAESESIVQTRAVAEDTTKDGLIAFPKKVDDDAVSTHSNTLREARSRRLGEPVILGARQRLVSDAALRAYRKSRLRSKEGSSADDEGKRSMRSLASSASLFPRSQTKRDSLSSTFLATPASSDELSPTSKTHISTLLSQLLHSAQIPSAEQWQKVLEPLIHSIIRHIHPNPRVGESMDIRQYIKTKRIPGGSVADSCYVDGFVLSKQVATKKMSRSLPLANPRVMVVTFPIDYHRVEGHFMSLEPLMAQEHEYTRILVARILQLRPNVLVVKDTVSRLALDMLEDAGVLVVWSIKMSAVQAISRCCQADIITSIDRLALEPRLGRCASFSVETYQHAQSSQCRKSIMRFLTSGSARSLGCTIILRGANLDRLGQVKKIVSMLAFVAHNLRLEEQLNQNEGAQTAPPARMNRTSAPPYVNGTCEKNCEKTSDALSDQIEQALVPFESNVLSASATITIPPPHALVKMKQSHDKVRALKQECTCQDEKEKTDHLEVKGDTESHAHDDDLTPRAEKTALTLPTLEEAMPKPSQLQASCARAQLEHDLYLQDWETCTNMDPTASIQKLSVLCTLMSSATQKPCVGPLMMSWHFYGVGDESLGHFLERTCAESSTICSAKGCGRPRGVHYSSFVHNETRVQVVQERFVCPIPGQENRLLMWSYCKKCEQATPVTPVSDDSWGFSFAKYLELHFYNVNKTTTLCGHDYYADFVRFFSLQNLAIRFHRDRDLTVREVVLPPLRLLPRPDVDHRLKLEGAKALQTRMDSYWASVLDRMAALRREPHMTAPNIAQLDTSIQMAKADEADLRSFLITTCRTSSQTDILALTAVRNRLQAAVVRWDQFFQEFEKNALPNERDMRRLTTHHLSRLFQERSDGTQTSAERVVDALGLAPAAEVDEGNVSGVMTALSAPASGTTSPNLPAPASLTSICDSSPPIPNAETEETEMSSTTSPNMSSPATWRHKRSQTLQDSAIPAASMDSSMRHIDAKTDGTDSELSTAAVRPSLRRGKTAEATPHRRKSDQSSKSGSKHDKIPTLKGLQQPSSGPAGPGGRRNAAVPRRGPPSSYKPPKLMHQASSSGMDNESDGGATSSSSIINQSIRRKNVQKRGRGSGLEDNAPSSRLQSSRVPVPIKTNNKVSTIARRFDNLAKEAERERERQKHVMAVRARSISQCQGSST